MSNPTLLSLIHQAQQSAKKNTPSSDFCVHPVGFESALVQQVLSSLLHHIQDEDTKKTIQAFAHSLSS